MHLVLVSTTYRCPQPGGTEHTVGLLAEQLALQHRVSVVCLRDESPTPPPAGVCVYVLPHRNLYRYPTRQRPPWWKRALWHTLDSWHPGQFWALHRLLGSIQPDVLMSHNLSGFSVSVWYAARLRGLVVIHVLHDYYLQCVRSTRYHQGRPCQQPCLACRLAGVPRRLSSAKVQAVVGVSRHVLDAHLRAGYFPSAQAHVVPNPVQTLAYRAQTHQGPRRFGFAGRADAAKGLQLLLNQLPWHLPHWQLYLAGPNRTSLPQHPQYADPRLHWLGYVDMASFWPQIDVLIVPSLLDEPFGRVAAEALQVGIPVVAARRGGLVEFIRPGINGYLFDTPQELALLLRQLLHHHSWAPLLPNCQLPQSFDPTHVARAYTQLAEHLCSTQ